MNAQRVLSAGLIAGGLAGIFLGILQVGVTSPLIHQAELYETTSEHSQNHTEKGGWKRGALTVSGAVTLGGALGILTSLCLYILPDERFRKKWTFGLLFGFCGFAAFHAIPALGLPPVPPGVVGAEADLASRQTWWLLTVIMSTLAFLTLALGPYFLRVRLSMRPFYSKIAAFSAALILFLVPFLTGIPEHATNSTAPQWLRTKFLFVSLATAALFWLALGTLCTLLLAQAAREDS